MQKAVLWEWRKKKNYSRRRRMLKYIGLLIEAGFLAVFFYAVFTYLDVALIQKDCINVCPYFVKTPFSNPDITKAPTLVDKTKNLVYAVIFGLAVSLIFFIVKKSNFKIVWKSNGEFQGKEKK
jgi:hypothetical protein